MTKKIYYDSAYIQEWETTVSEVLAREDGWYLVLEATAFYPHGGGQPCDQGEIGGMPVLDVVSEEEKVLHKVASLPDGSSVACKLDWARRFDHMQHHSGQHLLSAVCREMYQAVTLSFHLGTDYATIDIELPELRLDQLAALEREVNAQIYRNRRMSSFFVSEEELAKLPLVKQPKVTERIRIVEIQGIEYNACGGTHVASTGEIGMIKLLRSEKQKGNTRVYFKCGYRALDEFNDCMTILGALSVKYNTGKDEIMDRIAKWEQEHKQLQAELSELKERNDAYVAQELLTLSSGHPFVAHVFEDRVLKDLQMLAAKLAEESKLPVLLASQLDNKVVLANSGGTPVACGAFLKANLGAYAGKGGGSDRIAQAGFQKWEDASAFYEFASGYLKEQ
ncbi:DHHA1 domain-containing protein [Bacillus sp. 3255]|uniref:alanyl-tRNA editing protein n=1 Tax=Bacillus sp. 3255 TaxID=2817904 RepID=UPI002859D986|nr:DHHA1 domain-containing protein [Bacillus sp. 3255]MDR6879778.1 alanyl-tRNA synthetase [Bacillus sp. 3255]